MSKPQIGLIGCFQNGKSTLINCLLNKRVALTGDGVAKTKKTVRYIYGVKMTFQCIDQQGRTRVLDKDSIQKIVLSEEKNDIVFCEITLPAPLLKDVIFVDTPGFNANQEDTSHTTSYINHLDFIFFIIGGGGNRGALNEAERKVLAEILQWNKPFTVLYNCCDIEHWEPVCDNVRFCIESLISNFKNNGIKPYAITEDGAILPVNLAWYWQSLVSGGLRKDLCFFDETYAEKRMLKQVRNHFYDPDEPNYGLPSSKEMSDLSNIDFVKRYIIAIVNFINVIPVPTLTCKQDGNTVYVLWTIDNKNQEYSYELGYRKKDDDSWRIIETSDTKKTISGLDEGSTYEFHVRTKDKITNRFSSFSDKKSINIPSHKPRVIVIDSKGTGGMFD